MEFKQPTYEEYLKATAFAKFRYKYGIVVLFLSWITLIFMCYYMISHAAELANDPLVYACKTRNLECHCYDVRFGANGFKGANFYVNATTKWLLESDGTKQLYNISFIEESLKNINLS